MKNKMLILAAVAALASLTGCMSVHTTTTRTPVVHPDGTTTTNEVITSRIKGQDPLKDKAVKVTTAEKALHLKIGSTPGGTTGALSPLDLFFGISQTTIETIPVYAGSTNGYTPPISFAGSHASSLWNDANNSYVSTAPNLNPTNAYYAASVVSPNITPQISVGQGVAGLTNAVPIVTTNAAASKP